MVSHESVLLSTTLDPLPPVLQQGLVAVAFFGLLSLISTVSLFTFLTYRLCVWYHRGQLKDGANQFLILIYNLVLADIQQAMAFALTTVYLSQGKIQVGTSTCWANGWFVSTGDLASSVFIFAIALHTFYAVVKGRRVSNKIFYGGIAGLWTFVYALAIIGAAWHPKLYVRAGAWCWIDRKYDQERLWLHYLWIFLCMFGTVVVYLLIFVSLHAMSRTRGESRPSTTTTGSDPAATKRAAKYMIIYPVVYVICTLPLAGGRMASMTGIVVPYWWFCLAGAAITSCGWLDVLLYAVTRHVLIFNKRPPPVEDMGADTFGWKGWEWSHGGFWGTSTTVTGPLGDPTARRHKKRDFLGRNTRPLEPRHSDEDHLADQPEGVITTKTTLEITSGPIAKYTYADSESGIEMEDKSVRSSSRTHT